MQPIITEPSAPIDHCPTYDDPNHVVMLPYPKDCRKYYTCQKGQAFEHQCPENLYWSQMTYRCDYREYSSCKSDDPPKPSNEVTYSPFPGDCSRYYETRIHRCDQNLQWSSLYQQCVAPGYANCQDYPVPIPPTNPLPPIDPIPTAATPPSEDWTSTEPNYLPTDPLSLCRNSVFNAYIPYPGDCRKFIHCGPTANVLTCPGSLFWNPGQLSCSTYSPGCQY
ncbi:probable chitinase 10 [Drosophila rhopaloa]|uniref:Chitin-binding type-2 domain-containing protein n=1 Tax=Drosophila rhopaloa TaxID=1041015 RepID=A0ABM5J452_DRORH|nr:probable chitinase 10 [Drosophila rhopaloa]